MRPACTSPCMAVPRSALRVGDYSVRSLIACCVVEVIAPGLLVIKHRPREQSRSSWNIAVLEGEQVKVIDRQARRRRTARHW